MTVPPSRRDELTRIALGLLESDGPEAVSTRKVAAAYGASTMAVYSEFGSLGGLVASIVDSGFAMLAEALRAVPASDDAVADLARLGAAYRSFAIARPHLYRVIYAVSPLAGHRREGDELLQGADAFAATQEWVRRCYRSGRFREGAPYAATFRFWTWLHGVVMVELAGYLAAMPEAGDPVGELTRLLAASLGDDPDRAAASVAAALAD